MKINLNKKIIVANWKMNPSSLVSAEALFQGIRSYVKGKKSLTIICPPVIWQGFLIDQSNLANLYWGGQNCSEIKEGAVTGETSAWQLAAIGNSFCLVGHSEVRARGEDDLVVNKKIKAILKAGLIPLLCIGEKKRDKEGEYLKYLQGQIINAFKGLGRKNIAKVIICYEPLFAIGGQKADTPEEFTHSSLFIKKVISQSYGVKIGQNIKVLYGGSVDKKNADSFLQAGADGLLIGRASLKPASFGQIVSVASQYS